MSAVDDLVAAQAKPTPSVAKKSAVDALVASPTNPMDTAGQLAPNDRAQSAAKAVRGAIGKGVGAGLDLIDAPRRSNMAAMARDIAKKHGTKLTNDPTEDVARAFFSPGLYDKAPGPVRGIERGVMDFINDPVSVLGVTGLPAKGVEAFDRFGLPLANKIGEALNKTGNVGQGVTKTGAQLHNVFSAGGQFKRDLARDYGPQWLEKFSQAWGARNATVADRARLSNVLFAQRDKIFEGLSDSEKLLVLRAVDRGKTANLIKRYPNLAERATQFKELTNTVAHLRGSKALQKMIEKGGFTMPDYGEEFAADRARGIMRTDQYRKNYVPKPHDLTDNMIADPTLADRLAAGPTKVNLTKTSSYNLKRRQANPGIKHDQLDDILGSGGSFEDFIKSASKSIPAADLERRGTKNFAVKSRLVTRSKDASPEGVLQAAKDAGLSAEDYDKLSPSVKSVFERQYREFHTSSTPQLGRYKDVPKYVDDYLNPELSKVTQTLDKFEPARLAREGNSLGNASIFYQPVPHMRNIATLGLLADPAAAPETLGAFAKSGFGLKSSDAKYKQFRDAIKAGSVGVENEEAAATRQGISHIGAAAAKVMSKLPGGPTIARAVDAAGRPIRAVYDASGKILWGFDDAANATLTRRNIRTGQSPERAAYEARRSLVEYNNPSPAVEAGRYGMSFSTFRQKMPIAVIRSIAKNPQFAETLVRANPMLAGAKSPDANSPTGLSTMTSPLSETNELLGGDPLAYGRGSLNAVGKLTGNVVQNAILEHDSKKDALALQPAGQAGSKRNYFTYGQPDAKFIASQIPYVGTALDQAGLGLFPKKPGEAFMQGITGVRPAFPEGKENAANTKLGVWLKEHPNHTYGEYLSYLRGQKSARRYAR